MSSYYSNFVYKDKNSINDMNLIVVSFEPDNGFTDTFLSMDSVYENNTFGTRRFSYGAKYNSVATIDITVIKKDGSDFSTLDFRNCAQWLTGARKDSWLDMYVGDEFICSFLGKFINLQHYKLDARTVGLKLTFESVAPWAFSAEQYYDCYFGQALLIDDNNNLYTNEINNSNLSVDENGILYAGSDENNYFSFMGEEVHDGIIFIDNTVVVSIDNKTDDLYTYINLDTKFINDNCEYISIKNVTLDEETKIIGMSVNESILLSSEQFITSDIPNKIFGDKFNFIWPRIAPGLNELTISGGGAANVQFTYRYPMKVGDCVMDINTHGGDIHCGDYPSGGGEEFTGTIPWDKVTGKPDTIQGYKIDDEVYTKDYIDKALADISVGSAYIDENELNEMLENALG